MTKIGNDLINAYMGSDDLMLDVETATPDQIKFYSELIMNDSPKERLEKYLTWNGILGWTNRIWELSQGEM